MIKNYLSNYIENSNYLILSTSILGTIGFPAYWVIWTYVFPQPYDSLLLRSVATLLCIGLSTYHFLQKRYYTLFAIYWIVTMSYIGPGIHGYLMLANDFSDIAVLGYLLTLFVLFLLIYDIKILVLTFILGTAFSVVTYYAQNKQVDTELLNVALFLPVFIFVLLTGLIFTRMNIKQAVAAEKKISAEKTRLLKAKSAFLANMSHEIRTPMNAIIGFAEAGIREINQGDNSNQLDYLQTINNSSQHLLNVINDILDLSKIEAGKLAIENIDCNLQQLVLDTHNLLNPLATAKGLVLEIKHNQSLDIFIKTDPIRLKQLLINLLNNAIKFTHIGTITLDIGVEQKEHNALNIQFKVIDTGIGITPEQQALLFQPFTQASITTNRQFGGTGLGLSICTKILDLMSSKLELSSTPNQGSCFSFQLELTPGQQVSEVASTAQQPAHLTLAHKRILVVDDNSDNRRVIQSILADTGAILSYAEGGVTTLQLLKDQSYDLLLLDIQMPDIGGYQVMELLRKDAMYARLQGINYLPIIAITARAMQEDKESCLAHGADAYLSKPIRPTLLLNTISSVLHTDKLTKQQDAQQREKIVQLSKEVNINLLHAHQKYEYSLAQILQAAQNFVNTYAGSIADIKVAYTNNNFDAIATITHGMVSFPRLVGEDKIEQLITKLETEAEQQVIDNIDNKLQILSIWISTTLNNIKKLKAL